MAKTTYEVTPTKVETTHIETLSKRGSELAKELVLKFPKASIETDVELNEAMGALGMIRSFLGDAAETNEMITGPLKAHVKFLSEQITKHTELVKVEERRITELITYYRKVQRQREIEEQARLDRLAAERSKKKGSPIPETVAPIAKPPAKQLVTEAGKMGFTTKITISVIDVSKIPRNFKGVPILVPDLVAVRKLALAGVKEIPGFKIEKEEIPRRG